MVNCQPYLAREIKIIRPRILVALGKVAFERVLRIIYGGRPTIASRPSPVTFAHGAAYQLITGHWLLCSYHPSRQNTQTGRLTMEMFDKVWARAWQLLDATPRQNSSPLSRSTL
jgi:uracil-DNA glycosylase family 4